MKLPIVAPTIVFALSILGFVSVAAFGGQAKETSRDQLCARQTWPMIPENCIEGGAVGRHVRMVGADIAAFDAEAAAEEREQRADMQVRFAADFN